MEKETRYKYIRKLRKDRSETCLYEEEFINTCETVDNMIADTYPAAVIYKEIAGVLIWAIDNARDLCMIEENLFNRIETEWRNAVALKPFQATVLEWARTVLKICKKYTEKENGKT